MSGPVDVLAVMNSDAQGMIAAACLQGATAETREYLAKQSAAALAAVAQLIEVASDVANYTGDQRLAGVLLSNSSKLRAALANVGAAK